MSKKISYYQLRSVIEVMIVRAFEDESLTAGWTMDEFLETYAAELSSRHEEETYDISISAPPLLQ